MWPALAMMAAGSVANAYGQQQGAQALAREQERQLGEQQAAQQEQERLAVGLRNQAGIRGAQAMGQDPRARQYQDTLAAMRVRANPSAPAAFRSAVEAQAPTAAQDQALWRSQLMAPGRAARELSLVQSDIGNLTDWSKYYARSLRALYDQALQAAGAQGGGMREAGNLLTTAGAGMADYGGGATGGMMGV